MLIEAVNLLQAARRRIDDRDHWTVGEECTDKNGLRVSPDSFSAFAWCAWGAMKADNPNPKALLLANKLISKELRRRSPEELYSPKDQITYFNDCHTHDEVKELLDAVIVRGLKLCERLGALTPTR